MKKLIYIFFGLLFLGNLNAQKPVDELTLLSLSSGRYNEMHEYSRYERVGSAIIDMETMKIVSFISKDSLQKIAGLDQGITTRFLSVDPMARKYPEMNPYGYCANNPIRYIDPDGRVIVDANNRPITYSSETGWSPNATNDIRVIYNSLMLTETGMKQWNKAYYSSNNIEMKFSNGKLYKNDGTPALGKANQSLAYSLDGYIKTDKTMKIEISLENIYESFEDKNKGLTLREAIGATAGHEIEHTTDSNREIGIHNKKFPYAMQSIEKDPEAIGTAIRNESIQMRLEKMESISPFVEL